MSLMRTAGLAALVSGAIPQAVMACAVCISGANDQSANAFNWSMLFLLSAPYLVVGSIAGWLFYCFRRAAAKRDEAAASESLVHMVLDQKESGR